MHHPTAIKTRDQRAIRKTSTNRLPPLQGEGWGEDGVPAVTKLTTILSPALSLKERETSQRPARVALPMGLLLWLGAAMMSAAASPPPTTQALTLHVPSPDWRDQILYFVMIDRFDDGDPGNNDQGAGEFDPQDSARYSGGDLAGIERRVDYMQGLGATALWLTPPVAHLWWDGDRKYGGYHGYWAENFKQVDAHFGDLSTYRRLSHALHARGMYLVQDVVVNHVGNYFSYDNHFDATAPTRGFALNGDARPRPAPTQWPFTLNDVRKPEHRRAAIYHWTPKITDYTNPTQEQTWQLADLDDLNTENPVVRRALRDSYGYWIREVGVDAFRVDTAFHVPPETFRDFLHADDPKAPGVLRVAASTGRQNFHVFGEGFGIDRPYDDRKARKLEGYMRDAQGTSLLPGMINFPLYASTLDVFARGRPSAVLGHRIRSMMRLHANPHLMPSFVDNHDVDRFLAGGSEAALKQALLLILTLPGIPVIYAGTEQGFTEQRAAMFRGGYQAKGRDHFDTSTPLYRYLQRAIALRRAHPVLSRGTPTVLDENAAAPGALAYTMRDGEDTALVVFNSADSQTLLANLETGLAAGTRLTPMFAIQGDASPHVVGNDGKLTLTLAPRSGQVWQVRGKAEPPRRSGARITLAPIDTARDADALTLQGMARNVARFKLVVDGDLAAAQTITPAQGGHWQARIATDGMLDSDIEHRVVAWSEADATLSEPRRFRVQRAWRELADVPDPAGDDVGPTGRYRYPTDPDWQRHRALDIRRVQVAASGGSLRITLRLRDVVAIWDAPNGFDHLAVTAFIQLPDRDGGVTAMPMQHATLPDRMRWHYRLRAGGWTNTLFSPDTASATSEGTPVSPVADLRVDRAQDTITFSIPAVALGRPATLAGAKLYFTTWDYDGRYRSLGQPPQAQAFGGGDGARDPLVMDDTHVITLR